MSFQDASSSSATSCAMVLAICWPMSALPTVTHDLAVVRIEAQTVGSILAPAAASDLPIFGKRRIAEHEARAAAAVPMMKLRRSRFGSALIF